MPKGYSWCVLTEPWQWGHQEHLPTHPPNLSLSIYTAVLILLFLNEWSRQMITVKSFHFKCKQSFCCSLLTFFSPSKDHISKQLPLTSKETVPIAEMSIFPTVLFHSFVRCAWFLKLKLHCQHNRKLQKIPTSPFFIAAKSLSCNELWPEHLRFKMFSSVLLQFAPSWIHHVLDREYSQLLYATVFLGYK